MTELIKVVVGKVDIAEINRLIENGADVNEKTEDDMTALMVAAIYGSPKVISALLLKGADVNAKDNEGHTALMYAQGEGHLEVMHLLENTVNIY